MIVGDDFALVRNPKAASQSLTVALRPFGETYGGCAHHVCIPKRKWVIGCVRDPVSRMVSGWRFYCRHKGEEPLSDYLRRDICPMTGVGFQWIPQSRWLEKCNIILRFENLEDDFADMCRKLGIPANLPHLNRGEAALISNEDRALIRRRFKEDIQRFKYGA